MDAAITRRIVVYGDSVGSFDGLSDVLDRMASRHARMSVTLSGPASIRRRLAESFPTYLVAPPPSRWSYAARRFIIDMNLRVFIALDQAAVSSAMLDGIVQEGRALVALRTRPDAPPIRPEVAAAADLVVDLPSLGPEGAAASLDVLLARDHQTRRRRSLLSLSNLAMNMFEKTASSGVASRFIRRLDGAEDLRETLGRPDVILCLGNGPSSEDERLQGVAHDALFRVNMSWRTRRMLVRPDVVFTGMSQTMRAVDGAVFGLQTRDAERRLAKTRFLRRPRPGTRYFRIADVAAGLYAFDWGDMRPTNGAAMIATAVALAPRRLVIGGIDLFKHPAGAYPGDSSTPNAYAPAHDGDVELRYLLSTFASFRGELVIYGDVLAEAYAKAASG